MCNVHCDTNVCKVEPVAAPDESNGNDMMQNQLSKVFSRSFEHEQQYNRLLRPVTRLNEVVCLEPRVVRLVRVSDPHCVCVKVPDRGVVHDIQSNRARDTKVHCSVDLFHEAILFCALVDAAVDCPWSDDALGEEFAGKGQNDNVECHECKVGNTFVVLGPSAG